MKTSEYSKIDDRISIEKKYTQAMPYISPPHYHNSYEAHYFLKGDITFFIHDNNCRVKKGNLLFIDSYEIHHPIHSTEIEYEKILIMFKPSIITLNPAYKTPDVFSLLNGKFGGKRVLSIPEHMQQHLEAILGEMLKVRNNRSQYTLTYLHHYLSLFLTYVADYLESVDTIIDDEASYIDKRVKNIIAYINNNLERQLSLDEIAGCFNINKYYLCKIFKEQTGLSVIDFVNRKKIFTAERLISTNKQSITEIAMSMGFNNLTHFERTFKQITGTPPRSYRKNNILQMNTE